MKTNVSDSFWEKAKLNADSEDLLNSILRNCEQNNNKASKTQFIPCLEIIDF